MSVVHDARGVSWYRRAILVIGSVGAVGVVVQGAQVSVHALRPGTTVSAQAVVALVGYIGVGAVVGGALLALSAARGRLVPARPQIAREPTVEGILLATFVVGTVFFGALNAVIVPPGGSAGLTGFERFVAAGAGCVAVVIGASMLLARQRRTRPDLVAPGSARG